MRISILALVALLFTNVLFITNAYANWPFEFLQVKCVPKINFFEAREEVIYDIEEIQFEFNDKKRLKVVRNYAKEKSLFLIAGYPQKISCNLSDGTKILLKTLPNPSDEKNLFPGSAASLWVNGKQMFRNLSFPTDCSRTIEAVVIDKSKNNLVIFKMRSNDKNDTYANQLPISGQLKIGAKYDIVSDPWRVANCRVSNFPQSIKQRS